MEGCTNRVEETNMTPTQHYRTLTGIDLSTKEVMVMTTIGTGLIKTSVGTHQKVRHLVFGVRAELGKQKLSPVPAGGNQLSSFVEQSVVLSGGNAQLLCKAELASP